MSSLWSALCLVAGFVILNIANQAMPTRSFGERVVVLIVFFAAACCFLGAAHFFARTLRK